MSWKQSIFNALTAAARHCLPLGVDRAQISVLKQSDQVGLSSLLEGLYCQGLPPEVLWAKGLCHLAHQPLEGRLAYQEVASSAIMLAPCVSP